MHDINNCVRRIDLIMSTTEIIVRVLLALIAAPIVGCILSGIDRKLTAKLQGRVGPSIFQPFYDFVKLICKKDVIVSKFQNFYILTYVVFVIATVVMMFLEMDLLMILFVYTIANVALIVGSMSSGSPYSRVGASRETVAMLAYEPILVLFIIGMYMLTGSFNISSLNKASTPMIMYLPLVFVSMLFIMSIKFKKSPFDLSTSHHGHQELVKGMMTEFSGPTFAMVELTHWYEYIFLCGLMFLFFKSNIVVGLILAIFTFLYVIFLDNISARLTWEWLIKVTWTVIVGLSFANILFIYIYHIKIA